ncbi:MAG: mannose-1-phosphate guanylyltransferase [Bacteroidales bacterium]|nr:mannose-1-phosphate guanylyltransferase [Bacteroidales bacterium]
MSNVYCVILAGGIGSRLWPLSRPAQPKQFLDVIGVGQTMLQLTYNRFLPICPPERFVLVTLQDFAPLVHEQLPDVPLSNILAEPFKRNTAAAIALAAAFLKQVDPDATMVVTPADHVILNNDVFINSISQSIRLAQNSDTLMTIGVKAFRPETAYGYIQVGDKYDDSDPASPVHNVRTFTEKPNAEMANTFYECGDFCWNSGVFVWRRQVIEDAMRKCMPSLQQNFDILDTIPISSWGEAIRDVYEQVETISIDYAVLEKATNESVCLTQAAWSDIGAWNAIYEQCPKDQQQNAVVNSNAYIKNSEGCLVHAPKDEVLVVDGLKDYMVIRKNKMTLICPRSKADSAWRYASEVRAEMDF